MSDFFKKLRIKLFQEGNVPVEKGRKKGKYFYLKQLGTKMNLESKKSFEKFGLLDSSKTD